MSPIVELTVGNSELNAKNSGRTLKIAPKSAGSHEPCRIWLWENIPKGSRGDLSYTNRTIPRQVPTVTRDARQPNHSK
jgi:hypothetical protein